jgi:osmotically-inducible protein OsmY
MTKSLVIIAALALVLGAAAPSSRADSYPPDNTGANVRDRDGSTLTAGDQSETKADIRITQEIRQALIADKSLSMNAHNVKVITTSGVVTLRGPVDTSEEKAKVYAAAQRVPGVSRINNQLEIVSR